MSKYSESSPEHGRPSTSGGHHGYPTLGNNNGYPNQSAVPIKRGGKVMSGIPTNEPSMVIGAKGQGKHYPQQHTYGGYPSNSNESGDQVLFRSDGFDANNVTQGQ